MRSDAEKGPNKHLVFTLVSKGTPPSSLTRSEKVSIWRLSGRKLPALEALLGLRRIKAPGGGEIKATRGIDESVLFWLGGQALESG